MKERPILFSAPMVRAILDGRKTQTRRIMKAQPSPCDHKPWPGAYDPKWVCDEDGWHCATCGNGVELARTKSGVTGIRCPYGDRGDRLWVRETWGINHFEYCRPAPIPKARPADVEDQHLVYFATEDDCEIRNEMPKCPAIHMPRWASRITLEVTEVRIERLNDISADDAEAEGLWRGRARRHLFWQNVSECRLFEGRSHKRAFAELWDSVNGEGAWAADPWVWVVSFRHVDQQQAAA